MMNINRLFGSLPASSLKHIALGVLKGRGREHSVRNYTYVLFGGGGRIGQKTKDALIANGHKTVNVKRGEEGISDDGLTYYCPNPADLKVEDIKKIFQEVNADIIFNCAGQSSGSINSMHAVNTKMPLTLAKACAEIDIPMIHTCTYCAQSEDRKAPYASTKAAGTNALQDFSNVTTLRINVVTGLESDVPVATDSAISENSPFVAVPANVEDNIVYPVDGNTVVHALIKTSEYLLDPRKKDDPLPSIIDVAGEGVKLEEFLKLVNPSAIVSITIPRSILLFLAKTVNKGVFTEEFIHHLDKMNEPNAKNLVPDTSIMEEKLGIPVPSKMEVADAARTQLNFVKTTAMVSRSIGEYVVHETSEKFKHVVGTWPVDFIEKAMKVNSLYIETSKSDY